MMKKKETKMVRVFLAGDSTVAHYPICKSPMAGWGQMLEKYFTAQADIRNCARNGCSSNSFIEEGLLDEIWQQIKAGDYLLIQFGHNDQKDGGTDAKTTYPQFLMRYVEGARFRGAFPVLVTSVQRRSFNERGEIQQSIGNYPEEMKKLAHNQGVPLIDLAEKTKKLYQSYGQEKSKALFTWLVPEEHPNYPEGLQDNTHFSEEGARKVAKIVAESVKELKLPLQRYVKETITDG